MAKLIYGVVLGILVTQWAGAAPSDIKLEDIADVKDAEQTENNEPHTLIEDTETGQGQRQKRWYNFLGYGGYPVTNPVIYKRDDNRNTGVYGLENPLVDIHRRLQELSGFVRNPSQTLHPPIVPPFPQVIPILYIPQVGCGCTPNDSPNNPPSPPNTNLTSDNPDVNNRAPPFEDSNQNWGLFNNEAPVVDDENDGARPISFEPIKPIRPLNRPPPPVEHGSSQSDINSFIPSTQVPYPTTTPPRPTSPTTRRPPYTTTSSSFSDTQPPSLCDRAVLVCCITQQERDSNCFTSQGCPNPIGAGNACETHVVLPILKRLERYYKQRNG